MNDTDWLIALYQYPHTYCCCQQKPPMCGKQREKLYRKNKRHLKFNVCFNKNHTGRACWLEIAYRKMCKTNFVQEIDY